MEMCLCKILFKFANIILMFLLFFFFLGSLVKIKNIHAVIPKGRIRVYYFFNLNWLLNDSLQSIGQ